jgi:hypothetical protein
MNSTKCDECGHEIAIGEFPFCRGSVSDHGPWLGADEPIEGYLDTNLGPQDIEITTRGQRRAIMAKNGLEYKDVTKKTRGKRLYFDMGRA